MYGTSETADSPRGLGKFRNLDSIMTNDLGDLRERAAGLAHRRRDLEKISNPIRRRAEQVAIQQEEFTLPTSIRTLERAMKRRREESVGRMR